MRVDKRLNPEDSCKSIENFISKNEPFLITRIGLGGETMVTYFILNNIQPTSQSIYYLHNNAGFYGTNDYNRFANLYGDACKNCDAHVYWNFPGFVEMENFLVPENKNLLEPSCLESFRFIDAWTKNLKDKKVLIINPFKNEIDYQLSRKDKIWKNPEILSGEYITYASVQSIGGEGPHKDWYESYDKMCNDISKIEFDIALLSCGAYGLPLANFIRTKLNKSAIYTGGGLQLYFGILGKRWYNDQDVIKNVNEYWIRPNPTKNSENVEGGCYW
jgi:hypothetical protein